MNKKGQVNFIIGIFGFFMALVVVSVLLTPMLSFIDVGINATANSTNGSLLATLFNVIPVFLVMVLLIVLFALASLRG